LRNAARVFRILSLDVVIGAACGGLLAEQVAQAQMRPSWWIALLCAVWCVYTGDHLLDALRTRGSIVTDRHAFHSRHSSALLFALCLAVIVGLLAAADLRPEVRGLGGLLTIVTLAYLASAQGFVLASIPKEPIAGVLYAAGIWSGPAIVGTSAVRWPLIAACLHAIAATLNLAALGVFETRIDRIQGQRSLGLRFGVVRVHRWIMNGSTLATTAAAAVAIVAEPHERMSFLVLAAQTAMPAAMLLAHDWFARRERYRSWGDSIFFLGALPRIFA